MFSFFVFECACVYEFAAMVSVPLRHAISATPPKLVGRITGNPDTQFHIRRCFSQIRRHGFPLIRFKQIDFQGTPTHSCFGNSLVPVLSPLILKKIQEILQERIKEQSCYFNLLIFSCLFLDSEILPSTSYYFNI